MKGRETYLMLGAGLLALGLGLLVLDRQDAPSTGSAQGANAGDSATSSEAKARKTRAANPNAWATAKEIDSGDEGAGKDAAPISLSHVQADPACKQMRVAFRQETAAEVDQSDFDITVDLFDAAGQKLAADNPTSVMWWTNPDAGEAPSIMVTSGQAVAQMEFKLAYQGKEVAHRKYAFEER